MDVPSHKDRGPLADSTHLALAAQTTSALCDCGYSINATTDASYAVFTEILKTDFTRLRNISANVCWQPQTYNVSAAPAHGTYGKMATPANVVPNAYNSTTYGASSDEPGLQLWVGSKLVHDMVPVAEIVARDMTMVYGSFRASMKITKVAGTCSAFFWYQSNSEEIDMELLSYAFNDTSHPVYLVLQTPQAEALGYNAAGTSTYDIHQLPFEPSDGFHEYRFDWTPTGVSFYADGICLTHMTHSYPTMPGHLTISHWSNGGPLWSRGPPKSAAVTTVSYVKAYYNTSDASRQALFRARCPERNASLVCQIPDEAGSLDLADDTSDLFFNHGTMCGEGDENDSGMSSIVPNVTTSATSSRPTPIRTQVGVQEAGPSSSASVYHSWSHWYLYILLAQVVGRQIAW